MNLCWQIAFERLEKAPHKGGAGLHGFLDVAVSNIDDYTNQGRVAPVVTDRVSNGVDLGCVFTCNDAIMRLVPIQNNALVLAA